MSIVVFTYWETNESTGRKVEYIDHGYDMKTDKVVTMSPEPVATCDYIKWDAEGQYYVMK